MNESEIRQLRDNIYGPCTDNNWNACKENWMRPDSIEWLKAHQFEITREFERHG